MTNEPVITHRFLFNGGDNGGEQLVLVTEFFHNGDPVASGEDPATKIFMNQKLRLNSYSNSAVFELYSALLEPSSLRGLADQLESARLAAHAKVLAAQQVAPARMTADQEADILRSLDDAQCPYVDRCNSNKCPKHGGAAKAIRGLLSELQAVRSERDRLLR